LNSGETKNIVFVYYDPIKQKK